MGFRSIPISLGDGTALSLSLIHINMLSYDLWMGWLVLHYCRFVWDEAKYPTMSPLREIVDSIHVQIAKIEDDLKVKYGYFTIFWNNCSDKFGRFLFQRKIELVALLETIWCTALAYAWIISYQFNHGRTIPSWSSASLGQGCVVFESPL